jgi:hypothetical protein
MKFCSLYFFEILSFCISLNISFNCMKFRSLYSVFERGNLLHSFDKKIIELIKLSELEPNVDLNIKT